MTMIIILLLLLWFIITKGTPFSSIYTRNLVVRLYTVHLCFLLIFFSILLQRIDKQMLYRTTKQCNKRSVFVFQQGMCIAKNFWIFQIFPNILQDIPWFFLFQYQILSTWWGYKSWTLTEREEKSTRAVFDLELEKTSFQGNLRV